jgi:Bifunctional DNA primase/polymerase, N-terminal
VIDLDTGTPDQTPPAPWDQPGITSGEDVLAVLTEQAGQPLPLDTLTVATPSGGLHLSYHAPEGAELHTTQGERGHGPGWKIDTRAHGGYVLQNPLHGFKASKDTTTEAVDRRVVVNHDQARQLLDAVRQQGRTGQHLIDSDAPLG